MRARSASKGNSTQRERPKGFLHWSPQRQQGKPDTTVSDARGFFIGARRMGVSRQSESRNVRRLVCRFRQQRDNFRSPVLKLRI